jgi:NAD(P)-dependent dehydrogenase (short-subunit alcohol dehydrogenase family)
MCRAKKPVSAFDLNARKLCCVCAKQNHCKRSQTANLDGKVAVVTGCRIKIGFEIALKLLRAGCVVIGTTRFVQDARKRYKNIADYATWKERLVLAKVDFTSRNAVEFFCATITRRFPQLDILINNAAETLSRPVDFYHDLLVAESNLLLTQERPSDIVAYEPTQPAQRNETFFPVGLVDQDGQQLDLRTHNSWTDTIETLDIEETARKHVVNAIVPLLLIQRFIPLLRKDDGISYSFIVNVSAMEGVFDMNHKNNRHVGNNMAKSAMNMITRTESAKLMSNYRIAMNSVDTGWVSQMFPHGHAYEHTRVPLDCVDGAARVLDPVFQAFNENIITSGCFFKDYKPRTW